MPSFDCVVIGSGVNGLAAAVHLTRRGWHVALVERSPAPGGAVRTEEVTLPGFRHDLFAMNVSLFAGSAFYREHKAALDAAGLEFVTVANSFASAFPGGKWLGVTTDLDATCAQMATYSRADAEQWRAMAQCFPSEVPYIAGILGVPMPSRVRGEPSSLPGRPGSGEPHQHTLARCRAPSARRACADGHWQ